MNIACTIRTTAAAGFAGAVGLGGMVVVSAAPPDDALTVSYLAPPPELALEPFATVDLAETELWTGALVAVAEEGGAIVVDQATSAAHVIAVDGEITTIVELPVTPSAIVAGPGPVLYGLVWDYETAALQWVAIALDGPRRGEVVATEVIVDPTPYTEIPYGAFGRGPTGIVDRLRVPGAEMIGYVDQHGEPLISDRPAPLLTYEQDPAWPSTYVTVRLDDGDVSVEWRLETERHPESPPPHAGPAAPMPSNVGAGVYWTSLGPPPGDAVEGLEPTMGVLAALYPDGTAEWHSIPAGWIVMSSELDGTLLGYRDDDHGHLQVARLSDALAPSDDDAVATEPTPAEPATTAPAADPPSDATDLAPTEPASTPEPTGVTERINFAPGTDSATVEGAIVRGTTDRYLLEAAAGQTMEVSVTSLEDNAVVMIFDPDWNGLLAPDLSSGTVTLPTPGDYTVEVAATRGNATYTLTVTIT